MTNFLINSYFKLLDYFMTVLYNFILRFRMTLQIVSYSKFTWLFSQLILNELAIDQFLSFKSIKSSTSFLDRDLKVFVMSFTKLFRFI